MDPETHQESNAASDPRRRRKRSHKKRPSKPVVFYSAALLGMGGIGISYLLRTSLPAITVVLFLVAALLFNERVGFGRKKSMSVTDSGWWNTADRHFNRLETTLLLLLTLGNLLVIGYEYFVR